MRYLESESTNILSNYNTEDSVTIDVYRLSDNTKIVDAASMSEISTTGRFKYSFSQTVTEKTEYLYITTNSTNEQQGKIILGGYPDGIKDETDKIQIIDNNVDDILLDSDDLQSNQSDWSTAVGFSVPNEYDTELTNIQSDLNNPDQYKASGFSVPNEYDTELANIQSDLNNPSQYKANVSNLDVAVSTRSSHTAADIWVVGTRTLSSFGTLISDIWTNITRTLSAGTKDSEIETIKTTTDKIEGLIENVGGNRYTEKALEQSSGMNENSLHTGLDSYSNKDDYKAYVTDLAKQISIDYMQKIINNKKYLKKEDSVWYLYILDDDGIELNAILKKAQKDKDGNDISDLAAGTLAQELKSSV